MPTVAEKFRVGLRLLLAAAAIACCVCFLPGCASLGSAGNSASISAVPASADAYVPGELVVGVELLQAACRPRRRKPCAMPSASGAARR